MSKRVGQPIAKWLSLVSCFILSGCEFDVLNPRGAIGLQEKSLIVTSTLAMLIVVIPVILLTLFFAWRYRASNRTASYRPDWSHSTRIEVVIWAVPAIIILFLADLTWDSTHALDPYQPIASEVPPVNVEVVSLDWKWLFIYPDLGIASVNQLAMPVGTPVNFRISSDSVMNSFFIPRLGSQVYAMAGMVTQLHLIADQAGDYGGLSANFSGQGFSDMTFHALALPKDQFEQWVQQVRSVPAILDAARYQTLAAPSEANPVTYFSQVSPHLFHSVVMKYESGPMRMSSVMPVTEQ